MRPPRWSDAELRRRHPWHLALALFALVAGLEATAAFSPAAEALLFAPERALGLPARFDERPSGVSGPFPPALETAEGRVLYPVLVPLLAAFAFAQVTRHARLSYWLAFALFVAFPLVWLALGRADPEARTLAEAPGWAAAIGAVAGLVAGPRQRGAVRRAELAPLVSLLALGAIALYPLARGPPALFAAVAGLYAVGGAVVAWIAGVRWQERSVAAAAASGPAFGLALAAEMTHAVDGALVAVVLAPLWLAAALGGVAAKRRGLTGS